MDRVDRTQSGVAGSSIPVATSQRPDLAVDQVYGGSRLGNASDDPLPTLLDVDSGAGFRHLGQRPAVRTLKLLVLKTSFADSDWPDALDRENGVFIYYGDNRTPGDLHKTPRQGNLMLRNLFDEAHTHEGSAHFPPILLFGSTGVYRDVRFLGLAVPGAIGMGEDDDLVAVWRTGDTGDRFQNYKATFTVLDVPVVSRSWLDDSKEGNAVDSPHAPTAWLDWVMGRKYTPLKSRPSKLVRSKRAQMPETPELALYLNAVYEFYKEDPFGFERCAVEIARLFMPAIRECEVTRPWRDGGRDAVGKYTIAHGAGSIDVVFALEAKCYGFQSAVGVKPVSRLIARLRHRQFGILVTTSYLDSQAYSEIIQDEHPVVVIAGGDIANKLKEKFGNVEKIRAWLQRV